MQKEVDVVSVSKTSENESEPLFLIIYSAKEGQKQLTVLYEEKFVIFDDSD
jgi:hypothetical protein